MADLIEITRSFNAMNTGVEAIVCVPGSKRTEGEKALVRVQQIFNEVEKALSRFSPDSELSGLNRAAGVPFKASQLLFTVVTSAKEAASTTRQFCLIYWLPATTAVLRNYRMLPMALFIS
jgi:thiamine biosynthesis lipoprotein